MGEIINIGTVANDGTGDPLRTAFNKVNLNTFENVVTVKQASDFGTISSDKTYLVADFIDMGATSINIPDGQDLNIVGYGYNVCGLFSTEDNYTMFVGDVAGVGDIFLRGLDVRVSGTNSKVGSVKGKTGFEFISHIEVNFSSCTKLWELETFRQGEEFNTGRFNGTPQMEFIGTWIGGYVIDRSLTRFVDDTWTGALFKSGTGLTFGSRWFSNMNLDLGTLSSYLDFSASNFTMSNLLQLQRGLVTRDGAFSIGDTNITPNITEKVNESLWKGNVGLPNTDKGGVMTITTEALTTITTQNVWVDLAGTFTLTKNQHTDQPINNQLRNNTDNPIDCNLLSEFTIDGTSGDIMEMRATVFRDNTSTFEPQDMFSKIIDSNLGADDLAFFFMFDSFTLFPNDYVKYEIRNTTSTNNVTALQNQCKFKIQERN